uniref:Uncharacterized protein n=1 Tax=Anguilla anguilla TaxID=7936 RepID=A0A0E9WEW1_ANGAN
MAMGEGVCQKFLKTIIKLDVPFCKTVNKKNDSLSLFCFSLSPSCSLSLSPSVH